MNTRPWYSGLVVQSLFLVILTSINPMSDTSPLIKITPTPTIKSSGIQTERLIMSIIFDYSVEALICVLNT